MKLDKKTDNTKNYGIRPMKWHIYNKEDHAVLTWDDKAIEFDSEEKAESFLKLVDRNMPEGEAIIKEDILYYDGGYIDIEDILEGFLYG